MGAAAASMALIAVEHALPSGAFLEADRQIDSPRPSPRWGSGFRWCGATDGRSSLIRSAIVLGHHQDQKSVSAGRPSSARWQQQATGRRKNRVDVVAVIQVRIVISPFPAPVVRGSRK